MRILFITNLYPPYHIGGYEIACKDIAEGFKRKGNIIRVLTSNYEIKGGRKNNTVARMLDIKLKLNVSQTLIEKGKTLFFNPRNYRITKEYISDFKPDIVSFWSINGISASTIYAAERTGVPKVFHLFDRSLSYLRKVGKKESFNLVLFNRLRIDNLISSSSELKKDYVSRGFRENEITVIPHGVNLDEYPYKEKKIRGILKLLFVGQLWEAKGVHILLAAASILKNKGVNFKLEIIGTGNSDYVGFLHRICRENHLLDSVEFVGKLKRNDLIEHYHNGHILIFPSIWKEPFGIVLLEAMATGTPIIASRWGGPLDIVKNGVTGFFFEPYNHKDLASKILLYKKERRLIKQMGRNAKEEIEEYYNLRKILDQIKSFYSKIQNP